MPYITTVQSWDNNTDVFDITFVGVPMRVLIDSEFRKVFNVQGVEQTLLPEMTQSIVAACHDYWHAQCDAAEIAQSL